MIVNEAIHLFAGLEFIFLSKFYVLFVFFLFLFLWWNFGLLSSLIFKFVKF